MAYRKSYRSGARRRSGSRSGGRRVSRRSFSGRSRAPQTVRIVLQHATAPTAAALTDTGLVAAAPPPARRRF